MSPVTMLSENESQVAARAAASTNNPRRELDAVLGELAHAVANSLNTIAAASELAELLIARRELDGAAKSLTRIESECMRAARLLREGRKFLTFEVDGSDRVDIVALVRGCAEAFPGCVEVESDAAIGQTVGDAEALQRMITEILDNAFQSGANRVAVHVAQQADGEEVRLDFRDDGPGVTAPVARLFSPFFSTRAGDHSGLGLAFAARIAKAHGGSIGLDESASTGAFWITLPTRGS